MFVSWISISGWFTNTATPRTPHILDGGVHPSPSFLASDWQHYSLCHAVDIHVGLYGAKKIGLIFCLKAYVLVDKTLMNDRV